MNSRLTKILIKEISIVDEPAVKPFIFFKNADNDASASAGLVDEPTYKPSAHTYTDEFGVTCLLKSAPEKVAKQNGLKWPSISGRTGQFQKAVPLLKADVKDQQIVYGIVYSPDEEDLQGDTASADEIRKAAFSFMEGDQCFKINHSKKTMVHILETYLAPCDFEIEGKTVKKGSWVLAARVLSKSVWQKIKDGTLTGFSMAGIADAEPLKKSDSPEDDDEIVDDELLWPSFQGAV